MIAVDIHPSRLELAMELGATDSINTREGDLTEEIMRLTGGKGANYVIDTTARPELLRKGADALGLRGTLALVGAANPGTEVSFEIGLSLVKGWTFKTVIQGSSVPQVFIPKLIELWGQGRFPMDRIMRNYRHEDINQGFEDSHSGRTIKPVIVY
nr:hypothetical protein GCM10020092_080910 [Actinoplanes digitatis]